MSFKPDIIYLFNFPSWFKLIDILKHHISDVKYVFDVKTPLLTDGKSKNITQQEGRKKQDKIDLILTLSHDSVLSWIPGCTAEYIEYPLGIDFTFFPKVREIFPSQKKRFVLVSTIHEKRNIDQCIKGFMTYVRMFNQDAELDIYGTGSALGALQALIANSDGASNIRLMGKVEQGELHRRLGEYDAGIAWVPLHDYNNSPSLKILEYMAAFLPVCATATEAHKRLLDEGAIMELCSDSPESLSQSLDAMKAGMEIWEGLLKNRELSEKYDYENIVPTHIIPALDSLLESCGKKATWKTLNTREMPRRHHRISAHDKHELKMIFYINSFGSGKGGAERISAELASEMCRRGHLVYLLYSGKENIHPSYSVHDNCVLLPFTRRVEARKIIRGVDPSLVLAFYFNRSSFRNTFSMCGDTNIPLCIQECTNPTRIIADNWTDAGIRLPKASASWEREIFASQAARIRLVMPQYAKSFPPYIQKQVRAFSNPVFRQAGDLRASPEGVMEGEKNILLLNGCKANKNFVVLLEAFAFLKDEYPEWDVTMVGAVPEKEGPRTSRRVTYETICSCIEKNSLKDRVHFLGVTENVRPHYAASHIHVVASYSEGCPTVVLEAMGAGLPSIGFEDCPGTNSLIRHNENGLLACSDDRVQGLAAALRTLMDSPSLRKRLGDQAYADAAAFEPERIYDQWEKMFLEAAEYKNDPERLFREQAQVNRERALHARRMFAKFSIEWE
jgi:glycosyltransferase involved in cell wall biosynthesis